jgi:hypothetical protein
LLYSRHGCASSFVEAAASGHGTFDLDRRGRLAAFSVHHGLILYRYRGTGPDHRDNVGLRLAMRRGVPLVYLFGVTPCRCLAEWPTNIRGDDRRRALRPRREFLEERFEAFKRAA